MSHQIVVPALATLLILVSPLVVVAVQCLACWIFNKLAELLFPPPRPSIGWPRPERKKRGAHHVQEGTDPKGRVAVAEAVQPETRSPADAGVPQPTFIQAFTIVLVATILNLVVSVAVNFAILKWGSARLPASERLVRIFTPTPVFAWIMLPIAVLLHGGIIAALLPTSFGKGLLVALLCCAISAVLYLVLIVCAVLVHLVLGVPSL